MIVRIIVWIIFLFGGAFLGVWIDLHLFGNIFFNLVFHLFTLPAGIFLLNLVFKISKNTGRTLAKYGREGNIPRMQTNKLVRTGIYAYMRHPMHLGLMLFPVSIALIIGSLSFLIIISPLEILLMIILIKLLEEPEAIKKFGQDYINYMKTVPMFCLKPECIKELLKKY